MIDESNINRLLTIVQQIRQQAKSTDANNAKHKAHKLIENNPLFSISLFSTDSDCFQSYVDEVEKKIHSLSRLVHAEHNELAAMALEKIELQIQAIMTALNANKTMHDDAQVHLQAKISSIKARQFKKAVQNVIQTSQELYQKLSQHNEFERRLMNMLSEQESILSNCKDNQRQDLSQKVLVIHQRLGRCRKAISLIERDIEFAEKR